MKAENGKNVSVHYRGTLDNGTEFDNSHERSEPLAFVLGSEQMIPGFSNNIVGMEVGDTKSFTLGSEDAYGPVIAEAVIDVPKTQFPKEMVFTPGEIVYGQNPDGSQAMARIVSADGFTVKLDCNHPLAGENLTFDVEMVGIDE
jgi:peptidylprolyl isomerase